MTTPDQTRQELTELLRQMREYAAYSGELGIQTIAAEVTMPSVEPTAPSVTSVNPPKTVTPGVPPLVHPPRPAAAVTRTPAKSGAASVPQDNLFGQGAAPQPSLPASTETLEDIWRDIGECTRCGLCEGRTQVVNTHGNRKARLMFVGEAPGADEDAQGKPFVGRAGQLLTKMIEAMGMKREDVIIGNVNRCRPPGNRQPTLEEAAICRPFLFREIATVRPEVIVVMGNTALRNLLEIKAGISSVRGRFHDYHGTPVMPTFHPAYLLRDPSKKRETWEDLKKVMEHLDRRSA